jgi:hypothetical protein
MARSIPLPIHVAIETISGPALMVAPFVLDMGQTAGVVTVAIGVLLLGLALQAAGPRRTVPLSAHAGFDYLIAVFAIGAGLVTGLATGEWIATALLVGFGTAHAALTASTRFSVPYGA